jgi:hypothetical protein
VHLNCVWVPEPLESELATGVSPALRLPPNWRCHLRGAPRVHTAVQGPAGGRVHVLSGLDTDNNMVYSHDLGVGKVAAMKPDPASGEMKAVFTVDDRTTYLVGFIGPKDRRVMVTSNQHHDFPFEPTLLALGTGLYTEQVRWRDAATGAASCGIGSLRADVAEHSCHTGFGGRFYYPSEKGFIVLEVRGSG